MLGVSQARTKVADMLRGIVQERSYRAQVEEEAEEDAKKDMLGMLMENEEALSEEHMVDFMLALLVAGYETTSTIMTLAIKFLTETPLALSQLKVSSPPFLLHLFPPSRVVFSFIVKSERKGEEGRLYSSPMIQPLFYRPGWDENKTFP